MKKRITGSVFLAHLLGSLVAWGGEAPDLPDKERRSRWQGLPLGTWVIVSEKMYQDGKLIRSKREKLVQVSDSNDDFVTHDVYPESDGAFPDTANRQIRYLRDTLPSIKPNFKLKQKRQDTLEIDDNKYPCDVKEYTYSAPNIQRRQTVIYWNAKQPLIPYRKLPSDGRDLALPGDVLRVHYTRKAPGKQLSNDLRIVSLKDKKKVGENEFVCVHEKGVGKKKRGKKTITFHTERWFSSQVPGYEIEWITKGTINGVEYKRVQSVENFHVPKNQPECGR